MSKNKKIVITDEAFIMFRKKPFVKVKFNRISLS
jgi:hypothetical protein